MHDFICTQEGCESQDNKLFVPKEALQPGADGQLPTPARLQAMARCAKHIRPGFVGHTFTLAFAIRAVTALKERCRNRQPGPPPLTEW